jgi:hypothetical protein
MEYGRMIEIERNIVDIFDARRTELCMTLDAFGKKVYPADHSPYMRIQSLRKPQANGKPRRLPVGDFLAMCEALELDHVRVLIDAAEKR